MLWFENKISLDDDLADIVKDIFLIELLALEENSSTINDNLADEFDNTKECKIDLVDRQINFNENQVDLMKMTVDCTQK